MSLGKFTRRKLKKLATWPMWCDSEHKQLNQFHEQKMYSKPVDLPEGAIIMRPHWQYHIKLDGTRRARNCCDGSPKASLLLHGVTSTYSSCVEQPIQCLFFALMYTMRGYRIYGGDAKDAFAHSPPPSVLTYISIDDQYADWYKWKFHINLDCKKFLHAQHALQGHPEPGKLWEAHINMFLKSKELLGFKHTTHDRKIYVSMF